jgi:hypothetical protein
VNWLSATGSRLHVTGRRRSRPRLALVGVGSAEHVGETKDAAATDDGGELLRVEQLPGAVARSASLRCYPLTGFAAGCRSQQQRKGCSCEQASRESGNELDLVDVRVFWSPERRWPYRVYHGIRPCNDGAGRSRWFGAFSVALILDRASRPLRFGILFSAVDPSGLNPMVASRAHGFY